MAGQRHVPGLADRVGGALMVGMGVGERDQSQGLVLDLALEPACDLLDRGVDQDVAGEVDVDRVRGEALELMQAGCQFFHAVNLAPTN